VNKEGIVNQESWFFTQDLSAPWLLILQNNEMYKRCLMLRHFDCAFQLGAPNELLGLNPC